jgi:membrane-associated phospholipid phosphatase
MLAGMEARPSSRDPWLWVGFGSTVAFVLLAALVNRWGDLAFDEPVATAIRGLPIPEWTWRLLSALGGAFLIVVGTAFVVAALLSRRLRLALIVAGTLIVASVVTHLVKNYVVRPRPPWDHLVYASSFSFPSGHSLNSAVSYGLLAVVACRTRIPVWVQRVAVVVAVALPFLIGLSRIALGVHYPSDVLGGWLGGIAFVAAGATLIRVLGAMDRDLPRTPVTV